MTMSPLYPCGKPYTTTGTHNETKNDLAKFSSIVNGIMMESHLESRGNAISSSIKSKILSHFAVTTVIFKSRNQIGTGPK